MFALSWAELALGNGGVTPAARRAAAEAYHERQLQRQKMLRARWKGVRATRPVLTCEERCVSLWTSRTTGRVNPVIRDCFRRCPTQQSSRRMARMKPLHPIALQPIARRSKRWGGGRAPVAIDGLGLSIEQVWDRGLSMAQRFLHEHVTPEPILNLQAATEQTAATERTLRQSLVILARLEASGVATPDDYTAYNQLQANLLRSQTTILVATKRVFRNRPDVLSRLPSKVRKAPQIGPPATLSGFEAVVATIPAGAAVAAAGGTATLAPWAVAGLILAVLASLVILAYLAATTIGVTAETIRDSVIVKTQAESYKLMLEARARVFDACMAEGSDSETCGARAESVVPTPRDAAAPLPAPPGAWVPWAVLGLAIAGGVWVYFDVQKRRDHSFMMKQ